MRFDETVKRINIFWMTIGARKIYGGNEIQLETSSNVVHERIFFDDVIRLDNEISYGFALIVLEGKNSFFLKLNDIEVSSQWSE